MTRRPGAAVALLVLLASLTFTATTEAQVVVQSTTSTTAEVTVTGRVTTTTTDTLLVPEQPYIVLTPEPPIAAHPARLYPVLVMRGELTLSGARSMPLAGFSALMGIDGSEGWGGGLVAGYFGELGTNAPSEVHLALEGWRDFGPNDTVAFRLVARAGTALTLESSPAPQVLGQLGVGARVSVDPRIAILVDARGELSMRPSSVRGGEPVGPEVSAGLVITTALAIALD